MLLEFKMKNFKSFKEEVNFKMIPAQKIKDIEYSLISKKIGEKEIKALCSAVIYGPNSSGKTNIIGGMEVLRSILLSGNIKDNDNIITANFAVNRLELIPNIENNEPVYFAIKFFEKGLMIELKLVIDLGTFLDSKYDRKILQEELYINNVAIYMRKDTIEFGKIDIIQDYLIENFSKDTAEKIAQGNLDDKELFLNGMFKTLYSKKIYEIISGWLKSKFKIIYRADRIHFSPIVSTPDEEKKFFVDKSLNKAVKDFGLTSESIAYPMNREKAQIKPLSVIDLKQREGGAVLPAEIFESFGTIRFLNIFPMILLTIKTGATLVVDELDASIHPMAIMNIINIFHNDEINTKGAQLIFNTHNPIFLNHSLFRRDEIKFVEKEEDGSIHYALSDFGTSGKTGVRNTEDYMKNYFINKYGAIKDIDFSEIFIERNKESNKKVEKDMQ